MLCDPVICKDGHTMCSKCLDQAVSNGVRTCPVDRSYLGLSRPARNLALQAIILNFTIKCPNGLGCLWMGKLESMSSHKGECMMEMVECQNSTCTAMVYRGEKDTHQERCPHKSEACIQCDRQVKLVEMATHLKTCPKGKIPCPNKCGKGILR